ncbi:glycosyltransferase family 2 protein [Bradyrhizobium sp. BWC-3-1]|uniref:glycosyltransferase family 2 protein n=1 Tax=Bradyrhizobium sp. BWC-3-1 TaxID=3080012 RepID=UPI00293F4DBF|nr:glycosyltransferase family 2 protein [Bradyrhizobium sp. BWC-3-1]WOH56996.1 glycosyltransferase family 2 protein [Bradyrhizobium sp. BWC-3-1]
MTNRANLALSHEEEVRVFACVRNEALRIPFFLEYYRRIGVDRFFIVDNGSSDGTMDLISGNPDIEVFRELSSYREATSGISWINSLIARHGCGHWCVVVDADEFLVYPDLERMSLRSLTKYLASRSYTALYSVLLDMYSDKPICETAVGDARSLHEICPYYEVNSISYRGVRLPPLAPTPMHEGGVRERLFRVHCCLDKIAVFRPSGHNHLRSGRHAVEEAVVADIQGAILHYKLLDDFPTRVVTEVTRAEHWGYAREYRRYSEVIAREPFLSGHFEGSLRLRKSDDLLTNGVMRDTHAFRHWTSNQIGSDSGGMYLP